jgi:hypothetical protein
MISLITSSTTDPCLFVVIVFFLLEVSFILVEETGVCRDIHQYAAGH